MQKAVVSLVVVLALGMDLGLGGEAAGGGGAGADLGGQMLAEQRHFLQCLAYVYSPALWISHANRLYFMPRDDAQRQQIQAMKAARERYVAFTNRETRHRFVAQVLAESGLEAGWQKKLLEPYSPMNQYLTPILDRPVRVVERYSVLKLWPEADALIQAGESIYFVIGFGRGASDAYGTNALLVKEGVKTYTTQSNGFKTVEAFSDVALTAGETAALNRAVAAFRRKAGLLGLATADVKARQEFEDLKARATEASPFIEYLLAKAYLEGKGTDKDERLGLLWMNKAAHDGSGDASTYLEGLPPK